MPTNTFSNITRNTISGLAWSIVGTGFQAILRVVFLMILSRLLKPTDFGTVSVALIIIGLLSMISELGIGPAIVQINGLNEKHISTGFYFSLFFGFVLAAVLWVSSPLFASFFRIVELEDILRILSLVIPINSLSVVAENLVVRELQFRSLIIRQILSYAVGYGFVGIALSLAGFGVWALVGGTIGQSIVNTVVLLILCPHSKRIEFNFETLKQLLFLGSGYTAASVGNYFATQADNFVIGRWLGAFELGLYTRSYQLMVMPASLIGQTLDKVLFPTLARLQDDPFHLRQAYLRSFLIVALTTLPVTVFLFFLAPEIIDILLGPSWKGALAPFQILALGIFFRTGYKISDSLTRSLGAVYSRAWRQWIYTAAVLIGALIGKRWGVSGVAIGVLSALAIHFTIMTNLSLRLLSLTWVDIVKTLKNAMGITFVFGIESWIVSSLLRSYFPSSLPIFIIALFIIILTFICFLIMPESIIGNDNKWFIRTLEKYAHEKIVWFQSKIRE